MRFLFTFVIMSVVLAGMLFLAAGRADLPMFWAWYGILTLVILIMYNVIDPDLKQERLKPGPGGIDRNLRKWASPFFFAHLLIAGFDVGRLHFSDTVPFAVQIAALALFAGSMGVSMWAIMTNRFFSPVVRIQEERGHHVITTGPYRFIRHPGYAAALVMLTCSGIALGSWASAATLFVPLLLIIRRAVIEDRFLHENLPGYTDYAKRTRWRLVPGVW